MNIKKTKKLKVQPYLTVAEISEALEIHQNSTRSYIKKGELQAVKVGNGYRVSPKSFELFIASRSTEK